MFAKTIIDSDAFLDMPVTARLLYYDLSMRADDDGFINSPKKIMRIVGASEDDLRILAMRKFIIPFENGIVVIKHWRIHNYIRKDMYHETKYKEQKDRLFLDANNAYTLQGCNEVVTSPSTQVRLGKDIYISCSPESNDSTQNPENLDSIDSKNSKNSKKQDSEIQLNKDFEIIYGIYPKKRGRTKAFAAYKQWVTKGKEVNGKKYKLTNRQIYMAVKKYVTQQEDAGQDDYQYWKNFDTLMGSQLLDYVTWEDPK